VKPELTFRRSLRLISKRWWMMVAGGLVFAVLAFLVASNKNGHYVTSTNLTLYDQTVAPAQTGPGLELTPANPKFTADWTTANFLSENAAAAASSAVGGHPSASQILTSLTVTPLSTSQVQLTYTGSGDQAKDLTVLKTYAQSFINHRVKAEQQSISDAINSYNTQPNLPGATRRELAHVANQLAAVPSGFRTGFESTPNGSVSKVGAGGPPAIVVLFGGLLAGLTAGALLALAVGRFDKFVRRPNDIEVVGVPVVDIDSETDSASVQLLRSELELAGMGTRLGVMAITRATRAEGSSGLALALARTFAGVGTPTILVSGDLRARKVRSEEGLSALLDGTSAAAVLRHTRGADHPRPARASLRDRDRHAGRASGLGDAAADRLFRHRAAGCAARYDPLEHARLGGRADPARCQAATAHLLRPRNRRELRAGAR
jgi:hypothetical protein